MLDTTTLTGTPMKGSEITVGDRIAREHGGWSSPIACFNPEPPGSFAAKMFGPGVRTAWLAGDIPFGPIGDDDLYVVHRPAGLAEVA